MSIAGVRTDRKSQARDIINLASLSAGAAASLPLALGDALLLVPIQTGMISKLYSIYGRNISQGALRGIIQANLVSLLGRGMSLGLIRILPGLGSLTGLAINTSLALGLTRLMGKLVAEELEKGRLNTTDELLDLVREAVLKYNS